MITIEELRAWVNNPSIPMDYCVGIDDDGITLVLVGPDDHVGASLEVGGIPEDMV